MGLTFNKEFKVKFKVKSIMNSNKYNHSTINMSIIEVNNYKGDIPQECVGKGYFMNLFEGDLYHATAVFKQNKSFGYILEIQGIAILDMPSSAVELASLASKQIKGVSKVTMQKVIDLYGSDFISILNEKPESINQVPKLPKAKQEKILEWCQKHDSLETLITELLAFGIPPHETINTYKKYGQTSLYQIEKNPYSLYIYKCMNFKNTDTLVFKKNLFKINSKERVQCALLAFIDSMESDGNLCVLESVIIRSFNSFLKRNNGFNEDVEFSKENILYELINLVNDNKLVKYDIDEKKTVYYKTENFRVENLSAKFISEVYNKTSYLNAESKKIDKLIDKNTMLSEKQKEAVKTCVTNKFSILTGGPGTGKTFTIKAIIDVISKFKSKNGEKVKISLTAPTGKAAERMAKASEHEASTLHAALRLMPGDLDFNPDSDYKLMSDWIIIDEASMIDAKLFAYLIEHTSEEANIILCGDSNQLPSVGAGNVLDQLLKSGVVKHTELDKIFRQGKGSNTIVDYAFTIKDPTETSINSLNLTTPKKDFQFILKDNDIEISDEIVKTYKKLLKNKVAIENIMILTPVHKTAVGTDVLNQLIQSELSGSSREVGDFKFKKNDRIIQLKNNKELKLNNGSLGTVTRVFYRTSPEHMIVEVQFDDKEDTIELEDVSEIDLAYAMSIHKSQGSECEYVIMPFSTTMSHRRMLTNRLIYTGLTRAKVKFIGIGSAEGFRKGCLQKDMKVRQTLLSYLSKKYIEIKEAE